MRLFKPGKSQQHDMERMVGEVINIAFNMKFYDDAVFQKNPTKDYNMYTVEGITYRVQPSMVNLFLNGGILPADFKSKFSAIYNKMMIPIIGYDPKIKFPLGAPGSTQFLLIEVESGPLEFPQIIVCEEIAPNIQVTGKFYCCIHSTTTNVVVSDLPNSGFGKTVCEPELIPATSLAAIIYDGNDSYVLPDGWRNIDFPAPKDYRKVQNGYMVEGPVLYDIFHGLHEWVALQSGVQKIRSMNAKKEHQTFLHSEFPLHKYTLDWIAWEDVVPYNVNAAIKLTDLLKTDFLTIDQDWQQNKQQKKWRCAVTGVQLFEDIYVLDIFQQVVEKIVAREELSKYPFATIIETEAGSSKKQKNVVIQYEVKYNQPRHLLLSPYFLHCAGYENPLEFLASNTKCQFNIYRSFCPTTLASIIDESNEKPDMRQLLHELNQYPEVGNTMRRCVYTKTFLIVNEVNLKDLLEQSQTDQPKFAVMLPGAHI